LVRRGCVVSAVQKTGERVTTTIATDGFTIAGDGLRRTSWGCKTDHDIQKIRVRHGRVYALSGSYALFEPAIEWHHNGADPHKLPIDTSEGGWALLVLTHDGVTARIATYSNKKPYPEEHGLPFTMGSGCDYALGAMDHGAKPLEAVAIACKRDESTGGDIQVIDIKEAIGPKEPSLRVAKG
jgi:hypothetical protein